MEEFNGDVPEVIVLRMSNMFMINYNYLVLDRVSRGAVIVDPAWEMDKIDHVLTSKNAILKGILLTHSHPDHTSLSKPLAKKYNCPIWMSKEEIATSGFSARELIGIDAKPWKVGQMYIQPILTPGHTPGSICYFIGNNLFTGDTLFAEGCGLCPNVEAAHEMYASLEHLKSRINPETIIYPGHMYAHPPGQKFSYILQNNIYLHFKNENDFAAYRLRNGQNAIKFFNFR